MSLAKSFTEEQIATVQSWADAGDNLSEIQKKLGTEMEVRVTYMELRFLIDDLGVKLPEEAPPEPKEEEATDEEEVAAELEEGLPEGNSVSVTLSALQRPGALISGNATFSGGEVAEWWLDQAGQLGMNPKNEGFRPNQEQMMAFQQELQRVVQEQGY